MKVSINRGSIAFAPIELLITIESQKELQEVYHRFNSQPYSLILSYEQSNEPNTNVRSMFEYDFPSESLSTGVWSELDRIMGKRGIKP